MISKIAGPMHKNARQYHYLKHINKKSVKAGDAELHVSDFQPKNLKFTR